MNIQFSCIRFDDLTLLQLYGMLKLRSEVFVVEQNCVYQDIDGQDVGLWHCIGQDDNGNIVACTRLFPKNIAYDGYTCIGRVVASTQIRGEGLGRKLMLFSIKKCIELHGNEPIKISAQKYLQQFYESLGFVAVGNDYLEDGIVHIAMVRSLSNNPYS
jgi:ElaA protein